MVQNLKRIIWEPLKFSFGVPPEGLQRGIGRLWKVFGTPIKLNFFTKCSHVNWIFAQFDKLWNRSVCYISLYLRLWRYLLLNLLIWRWTSSLKNWKILQLIINVFMQTAKRAWQAWLKKWGIWERHSQEFCHLEGNLIIFLGNLHFFELWWQGHFHDRTYPYSTPFIIKWNPCPQSYQFMKYIWIFHLLYTNR